MPWSERIAPLGVSLLNRVIVPSVHSPRFRRPAARQSTEPIRDLGTASRACGYGATGLAGNLLNREVLSRFPDSAPGETKWPRHERLRSLQCLRGGSG